jgi:hypothetical protein
MKKLGNTALFDGRLLDIFSLIYLIQFAYHFVQFLAEAEFWDVIGKSFYLCYSQVASTNRFYAPHPPPPPTKEKWFELRTNS